MRIYIVGAGFSLHSGYPLTNDLLDEIDKFIRSEHNADADLKREWPELQHLLENSDGSDRLHPALSEAYRLKDIEALISLLDAIRNVVHAAFERDAHEHLGVKKTGEVSAEDCFSLSDKIHSNSEIESKMRNCIVSALTAYFEWKNRQDTASGASLQWKLIHEFCDQRLKSGDVIISFNYDCSLERVLLQQGQFAVKYIENWPSIQFLVPNIIQPENSITDKGEILLLKLHGSVGWLEVLHQGCVGISPAHLEDLGAKSEIDYPHNGDWQLATNRPMIIPTWFKMFLPDHLFAHLWTQALKVMGEASEVIVIGYSFPKADSAAWVLRQANSGKWQFVDRAFGKENSLHHSFESWMNKKDSRL